MKRKDTLWRCTIALVFMQASLREKYLVVNCFSITQYTLCKGQDNFELDGVYSSPSQEINDAGWDLKKLELTEDSSTIVIIH